MLALNVQQQNKGKGGNALGSGLLQKGCRAGLK